MMGGITFRFLPFLWIFSLPFFLNTIFSADTINSPDSLSPGQTLVSSNDVFQLGFFTPDNSSWYVGIWYKNVDDRTYVWVANGDSPINNSSSGILKIGNNGNIVILDPQSNPSTVWSSSNLTAANPVNPVAQLLDTGNLVVREATDESNYLWQSFDYPTNTLLPDMKLGWDLQSGISIRHTLPKSVYSIGIPSFILD